MSLTVEKPNKRKIIIKDFSTTQDYNANVLFKHSDRCVNKIEQYNVI